MIIDDVAHAQWRAWRGVKTFLPIQTPYGAIGSVAERSKALV